MSAFNRYNVVMESFRSISIPKLGWSLLLSWVFCVFYLELSPLEDLSGRVNPNTPFALGVAASIVPVAFAVATLALLVVGEREGESVDSRRACCVLAPICATLATPFLLWHPAFPGAASIYLIAGAVSGVASGVMWVLWGILYSRLSQDGVEATTLASAAIAVLVVLACSAMSGWVAVVLISGLPLFSGFFFLLAQKEDWEKSPLAESLEKGEKSQRPSPGGALRAMGRSGWGIFAACFFTCVLGALPLRETGFLLTQANVQIAICASLVLVAVVGTVSVAGPRRMSVSFIFRWMCPVLVCGYASVVLFDGAHAGMVAFCVSLAARFAFCVIAQVYFARFAVAGLATPTQSYGLGWIFVHAGDFAGSIVLAILRQARFSSDPLIALTAIVLLVAVAMYVLGDRAAFSSALGLGTQEEGFSQGSVAESGDFEEAIRKLAERLLLTPRETEIFSLLMRGRSVPYIRDALVVSRDTAATHVKHIYQKAGVHSRQELLDLL